MVMLHIKLNGIAKCSSMVAIILPADRYPTPSPTPLTLGLGQRSKIKFFKVANILPKDSYPSILGMCKWVKIQLFQNMVMLHIILKRITNAATRQQIFYPKTPPPLPAPDTENWVNRSKFTFSEHAPVA